MAMDFSKLNFFSRLGARARLLVLFSGVLGVILVVYLGVKFFSAGGETTGPSRVASAPQGLQSVPGGQLTPEYYRALAQANVQAAQQAQISGGSAIPTLVNVGQPAMSGGQSQCNVICPDEAANVKYTLDDWVKQGKISPEVATGLQQLADKNVSVAEYASELDRLVKAGKLTPEQARILLEQYRKQHTSNQLQESGKLMDPMIKSGQLPLEVANTLLEYQKKNMSPDAYAASLRELVRQGKISPAAAQQLLTQYAQQRAKDIIAQSVASLRVLASAGQITPEVESTLVDLEQHMVSVEAYSRALQKFIDAGKLIPLTAGKILDEFKQQKASIGSTGVVNQMLKQAEAAAFAEISDLLKAGKITQEVADVLRDMINKNVTLEMFQAAVNDLVQKGKLTPEIGKLKIADYKAVKGLRDMQDKLVALQGNNASPSAYADELKNAVQTGLITPEQAAQLLQDYQALNAPAAGAPIAPGATDEEFAKLQQRLQEASAQGQTGAVPTGTTAEFAEAQARAREAEEQAQQAEIDAMMTAMSTQAQELVAAWQPVPMQHKEGTPETPDAAKAAAAAIAAKSGAGAASEGGSGEAGKPVLIKAGTILFAVLDTAVNSDYPDSPVMATVVDGKYKGAKLLGKLTTTKGVSGQLDRVALNFTIMNVDSWPKSKTVTAYAIDPDSARTVLASTVNYHYLQRFGAIMATSFIQGYANAVNSSSSTTTTGIFGTSTTHPELSPTQKLASAVGQIGQSLSAVTQNYVNIPPTVKVDSGVGLGILFMSDIS